MWLFTAFGFYSVVQKGRGDQLCVRARVSEDLDRLRDRYLPTLSATEEGGGTDYEYRAWVPREALAAALGRILGDLQYENFKNEVQRELGPKRAHACHDVWRDMRSIAQ